MSELNVFTLQSYQGEELNVSKEVIKNFFKAIPDLEDIYGAYPCSHPAASLSNLQVLVDYCQELQQYHKMHLGNSNAHTFSDGELGLQSKYQQKLPKDPYYYLQLCTLADFLGVEVVVELGTTLLADLFRGKQPLQCKDILNVKGFTKEQIDGCKKLYPWAWDKDDNDEWLLIKE